MNLLISKPAGLAAVIAICFAATNFTRGEDLKFTDTFGVNKADLASVGTNRFFVLAPGFCQVLKGQEDGRPTVLTITVLDQTKRVDGVETRVVEEREVSDGKVVEISRNYFAISKRTTDVFYFGEDSDTYKDGRIASREGSWLSGVAGAKFGLMIPGTPLLGARYQQENAPGAAMDRAEVVSLTEHLETPAGRFTNCLKTEETSGIERGKKSKLYAPDVGLIQDGGSKLASYGFNLKTH